MPLLVLNLQPLWGLDMSEKTAKKLRQALRKVNVAIEPQKYYRHKETGAIVAEDGRRIYKRAKRKAREIRKDGKLPQF